MTEDFVFLSEAIRVAVEESRIAKEDKILINKSKIIEQDSNDPNRKRRPSGWSACWDIKPVDNCPLKGE